MVMLRTLNSTQKDFAQQLSALLNRSQHSAQSELDVEMAVAKIIADVRQQGDVALCSYTKQFDGFDLKVDQLEVSQAEIERAYSKVNAEQRASLHFAADRIGRYHEHQIQHSSGRQY